MSDADTYLGAATGLLGVAIMVDVAGKAMNIAKKIPKPNLKVPKKEKIKW